MPEERQPHEKPRPSGRREETHAGADAVTAPEPAAAHRAPGRHAAEAVDAGDDERTGRGPSPEALDARDRGQSPKRKAAGPKGGRGHEQDVVIEESAARADPLPTDPR
jgi:hypothetical protein